MSRLVFFDSDGNEVFDDGDTRVTIPLVMAKPKKPTTNADRIRAMNDEELAEFLWSIGNNPGTGNVYLNGKLIFFCGDGNGWLDWLREERKE
ncbi:MAG: hypothetical protein J6S14_02325 [Clostridia bacterium]|nr:hypothetical protein [Clostridia bacterium]